MITINELLLHRMPCFIYFNLHVRIVSLQTEILNYDKTTYTNEKNSLLDKRVRN